MGYQVEVTFNSEYLDEVKKTFEFENKADLNLQIANFCYDYITDNIEEITEYLIEDVKIDYDEMSII